MPNAVILVSSDADKRNLSDEAWAAFQETGEDVPVPLLTGLLKTFDRMNEHLLREDGRRSLIILRPHARTSRRRPTNVTIKEELSATEVETMLARPPGWKLAVPNGDSTDVLTEDKLREAWHTDASGTVKLPLRGADNDEQAVLDDARERLSPKGGAARVTSAIGAPIAQIAVLGTAYGAFVGWKGDDVARPWLLYLGACFALAAVILSWIGSYALKRSVVNLSRLDLLQRRSFRLPTWLTNGAVALFALALVALFFSNVPAASQGKPSASFGQLATSTAGPLTKASFTVKWANLGSEAAKVTTTLGGVPKPQTVVTPKDSHGKASQALSVTVRAPATVTVSTQALDAKNLPVGDKVEHTYKVSRPKHS